MLRRHEFRAMGTQVWVIAPPEADPVKFAAIATGVEIVFEDQEQRFSRFRYSSELSMVNRRAGTTVNVSPDFAEVCGLAIAAARRTEGLFDPTILPALIEAGYDRDFAGIARPTEPLAEGSPARESRPENPGGVWENIELDGTKLRIPENTMLDFGGLAKGWTVDRAAGIAPGAPWTLIGAGGDIRVVGHGPKGGLDIALEDPFDRAAEVMRVRLEAGAIATSSVTTRSWGKGLHHIIDPRTGKSLRGDVIQASAWAPTCSEAEVLAKWALLTGPSTLDHITGTLVMQNGDVVTNLTPSEHQGTVAVGA